MVQHLGHTGPDGNASPPTTLSKSLMEHLWDSTQKDTRRNTHTAFHMLKDFTYRSFLIKTSCIKVHKKKRTPRIAAPPVSSPFVAFHTS